MARRWGKGIRGQSLGDSSFSTEFWLVVFFRQKIRIFFLARIAGLVFSLFRNPKFLKKGLDMHSCPPPYFLRNAARLAAALVLLAGFGRLEAQDLKDGLVSYWPLDEVRGTKTPDLIGGYDMDLTNLSAEDLVDGQTGMAFEFSNARETLLSRVHQAGEDLPANQHESWTLSIWAKLDGVGQNDLRIFSEGNTENSNPLFNLGTHNQGAEGPSGGGQLDLFMRQDGWPTVGHIYTMGEPFDGEWHHIVFVQENGLRSIYIDGELDDLEIGEKPEGDWLVNNTSIGGILRSSASHWVSGVLDEVAIWKRALSEEEIAEIRDNGMSSILSPLARGLVSYWPLDEVRGTKTPDLIGGYDMDLTNLSAEDLVDGQTGMAFEFSNARETLLSRVHQAGEDLPANQHESWTLSIWAKLDGVGQNDLRIFSEGNTENSNPLFNLGTHNQGAEGPSGGGQLDLFMRQDGWPTVGHIYTMGEPFDGEWHHIVFVQENGLRSIYIDGELDDLEIGEKPEGDWLVNNTSIGGILRSSASHWVSGVLDEVAIWKRALSEEEIAEIRDNGVPESLSRTQPLVIRRFAGDYPAVVKDGSVVLRWDASADAALSINHGVGDVTADSVFGVGSKEVSLEATKTFTLTAARDGDSVSADFKVSALDGVREGWTLIDNFDAWPAGSIKGLGSWKNPVGSAEVLESDSNHPSQSLIFGAATALNAVELKSLTIEEGERTTVFFRMYAAPDADGDTLNFNVGLSEKPIRFVGDFDNDVGPFIQFDNTDADSQGELELKAINGVGESLDFIADPNDALEYGETYNVWLDVDNQSIEDGDTFNIHIQKIGGERKTIIEDFVSDRNPAGSADLGAVQPQLETLFTTVLTASQAGGIFRLDDFYLSNTGEFNDTVPIALGATEFLPEVEPPAPPTEPPSISVSVNAEGMIVIEYTGRLHGAKQVDGQFHEIADAPNPFLIDPTAGDDPAGMMFYLAR